MHENIPRIGVGVSVIRNGKVLWGLRKGDHGGGLVVSGRTLEFGESPEECAKRELEEETGLIAGKEDFERGSVYE